MKPPLKNCAKCGTERKRGQKCQPCERKRVEAWQSANPEKVKAAKLRYTKTPRGKKILKKHRLALMTERKLARYWFAQIIACFEQGEHGELVLYEDSMARLYEAIRGATTAGLGSANTKIAKRIAASTNAVI